MSWLSKHLPGTIRFPLRSLRTRLRRSLAVPWRALFVGTTFIGVTGSHGKTTTTMLLARMLHFRASTHVGLWFNEATAVVRVLNQDFARVDLLQHFDLAIGNPPFSDRTMRSDPAFRPLALRLHD